MARGRIKVGEPEYLSILDENGQVDSQLVPDIPEETLKRLHRTMRLSRSLDDRLLELQRTGRIGTFAPVNGQEAAQLGSVATLRDSDWMVPSYRETAVLLWRGVPLDGLFVADGGYNEGGAIAEDQNDLPMAVPVGSQLTHAAGIGYGMRYRDTDEAVMVYFGDGATSEGDFHEGMNFAAVFGLPVVFVCENNQWAISVPRSRQTASKTLAQKAIAYEMPGIQVDGNDVLAVYAACAEAVERAREEHTPTMVECVTYRMGMHTTADDPGKYRSEEEVERWAERDPVSRFEAYLQQEGVIDDDDVERIDGENRDEIEAAWQKAEARMAELDRDPLEMFAHHYAELPPYLAAQRDAFARRAGHDREQDRGQDRKRDREGGDG